MPRSKRSSKSRSYYKRRKYRKSAYGKRKAAKGQRQSESYVFSYLNTVRVSASNANPFAAINNNVFTSLMSSPSFNQYKNNFDQWKLNSVNIHVEYASPLGITDTNPNMVVACFDRTGFPPNVNFSVEDLMSYGSAKTYTTKANKAGSVNMFIAATTMEEKCKYYSTDLAGTGDLTNDNTISKWRSVFIPFNPSWAIVVVPLNQIPAQEVQWEYSFNVKFTFNVTFRGQRLNVPAVAPNVVALQYANMLQQLAPINDDQMVIEQPVAQPAQSSSVVQFGQSMPSSSTTSSVSTSQAYSQQTRSIIQNSVNTVPAFIQDVVNLGVQVMAAHATAMARSMAFNGLTSFFRNDLAFVRSDVNAYVDPAWMTPFNNQFGIDYYFSKGIFREYFNQLTDVSTIGVHFEFKGLQSSTDFDDFAVNELPPNQSISTWRAISDTFNTKVNLVLYHFQHDGYWITAFRCIYGGVPSGSYYWGNLKDFNLADGLPLVDPGTIPYAAVLPITFSVNSQTQVAPGFVLGWYTDNAESSESYSSWITAGRGNGYIDYNNNSPTPTSSECMKNFSIVYLSKNCLVSSDDLTS